MWPVDQHKAGQATLERQVFAPVISGIQPGCLFSWEPLQLIRPQASPLNYLLDARDVSVLAT